MNTFAEYLDHIENPDSRDRMREVLDWVTTTFPNLGQRIAWNQPMFTDHGTFIIGFSVSKHHMAISPEHAGILYFSDEIIKAGYEHTPNLVRIPWDGPVDYSLLEKMIAYNILDKADFTTFWRQ